jgi:DNA-binding response OmpR family regulator
LKGSVAGYGALFLRDVILLVQKSKSSVFLLEDDPMLLLEMRQDLEELGWQVDCRANSIAEAITLAPTADADVAILDINVGGVASYSVAELFKRRRIPVIFITGADSEKIRTEYPGAVVLSKPYSFEDLKQAMEKLSPSRNRKTVK